MKLPRREIGLLWRVRDLFNAASVLYRLVNDIEAHEKANPSSLSLRIDISQRMKSVARAMAIEEGKQHADLENFGLNLQDLGKIKEGKRQWDKKKKM